MSKLTLGDFEDINYQPTEKQIDNVIDKGIKLVLLSTDIIRSFLEIRFYEFFGKNYIKNINSLIKRINSLNNKNKRIPSNNCDLNELDITALCTLLLYSCTYLVSVPEIKLKYKEIETIGKKLKYKGKFNEKLLIESLKDPKSGSKNIVLLHKYLYNKKLYTQKNNNFYNLANELRLGRNLVIHELSKFKKAKSFNKYANDAKNYILSIEHFLVHLENNNFNNPKFNYEKFRNELIQIENFDLNSNIQRDVMAIKNKNKKLENNNKELENDNEELKNKNNELENDKKELENDNEELENNNKELKNKNKKLINNNKKLKNKYNELENKYNELEIDLAQKDTQNEFLNFENNSLKMENMKIIKTFGCVSSVAMLSLISLMLVLILTRYGISQRNTDSLQTPSPVITVTSGTEATTVTETTSTTTTTAEDTTTTTAFRPSREQIEAWTDECLSYAQSYASSLGITVVEGCTRYDNSVSLGNGYNENKNTVKARIRSCLNDVSLKGITSVTIRLDQENNSNYIYTHKLYILY